MKFKNTNFVISKINARDAIYIDKIVRDNNQLTLEGVANNRILLLNCKEEFIPIKIIFEYVAYIEIMNIDYSSYTAKVTSNFDILENSSFIEKYYKNQNKYIDGEYQHYILLEYDEIYQIIAGKCSVIV